MYDDDQEDDEIESTAPLYSADPGCDHDIRLRNSGYGCTKCPGWYCA